MCTTPLTLSERRANGFTLIEMLVTVCVLSVTLGLAAPTFQEFTATQAIRSASFDLTTDLVLARSEAVKRNSSVLVSRQSGGWDKGWQATAANTGELVTRSKPMSSSVSVDSLGGVAPPASIQFNADGRVEGNAVVQLQLSRSLGAKTLYKCITLDPSGLPRTNDGAC